MVLVSESVPLLLTNPPPVILAELLLTVESASVVVPDFTLATPPPNVAELPLTVHSVSESVPPSLYRPPPLLTVPSLPNDPVDRPR